MNPTSPDPADIWLLDDDPDVCFAVSALLQNEGWNVQSFRSPLLVLRAAEAADPPPGLVIIDLLMPELDGFTVIRRLRNLPSFQRVPLIALSALADQDALLDAFKAGADDFVRKPFDTDELFARVRNRLQQHRVLSDLDQRHRDAAFLLDLSSALNLTLDFRTVLRHFVQEAALALGIERCSIILLGRFQHFGAAAPPEHLPPRSARLLAASDNLEITDYYLDIDHYPEIQQLLQTHQPVIVEEVARSPLLEPVRDELRELGVRSVVLFPMKVYDELVGVLFMRSTLHQWHLDPRRRDLALATAHLAGNALRNAWLFEELRDERQKLTAALSNLHQAQETLQRLIDASVDAIVAADMDGRIIVFNKAAEAILGHSAERARDDLRVWHLYPGRGASEIMNLLRSHDHGGAGRLTPIRTHLLAADGSAVPVSLSAAIVYDGERERATMGVFTDLRDRLRMEQQLAQANEDLEQARRQAVVAELAGAAAHELNQPLTSVLNYAELLRLRLGEDHPQRDLLRIILEQSERMSEIIKKIGSLQEYRTRDYVGSTRIVDLGGDQQERP